MVDPKKHADHRGWIESILSYVPGFSGYLETEYRRESDRMTRQHLVDRLAACRNNLDKQQEELVVAGNLNDITQYDRVVSAIMALGNRVAGSVQGYSGFFDFVNVGTAELDRVYEHDLALLKDVEELFAATKQLNTSQDHQAVAKQMKAQVDSITEKYNERTKILQGLSE